MKLFLNKAEVTNIVLDYFKTKEWSYGKVQSVKLTPYGENVCEIVVVPPGLCEVDGIPVLQQVVPADSADAGTVINPTAFGSGT